VSIPGPDVLAPRPRVALIPCSRWPAKNWPAARFAQVGAVLQSEKKASVYLMGSAADRTVCEEIAQRLPGRTLNTAGETGLVELCGYLQAMDLVVSVDSGPMHAAAAGGVPVLAVFGATDPRRTGPYGPRHRVVMSRTLDDHADPSRLYRHRPAAPGGTCRPTRSYGPPWR